MADMNAVIARYLELRTEKERLEDEIKDTITSKMKVIEGYINTYLVNNKQSSARFDAGTLVRTERRSVKVDDYAQFDEFAKTHPQLVKTGLDSTECLAYIDEFDVPPPGVAVSRINVLYVKAPK